MRRRTGNIIAASLGVALITAEIINGVRDIKAQDIRRQQREAWLDTLVIDVEEAETEQTVFVSEYENIGCWKEDIPPKPELPIETDDSIPMDKDLKEHIKNLCEQYNTSYELAMAIIFTESSFRVDAVGDNGQAIGLCQIQPKWWSGLAAEHSLDIYDPADNVELMLIILNSHLEATDGNLTMALQKYNTGSTEGSEYADRVYQNMGVIYEN